MFRFDWEIDNTIFKALSSIWGPFTVDRFASHLNAKCTRFNSRWLVPGTEGIDCLAHPWNGDINCVVPPPRLIPQCIDKIIQERANCTLIIPKWKSAAFWPKVVTDNGTFNSFVKEALNLGRTNVIKAGRGNNGCFGNNPLVFDMLALKSNF